MRAVAAGIVLGLSIGAAQAADPPNIVGTWTSTGDMASSRLGSANAGFPESQNELRYPSTARRREGSSAKSNSRKSLIFSPT